MTRVLSGAVLIAAALGVVWLAPSWLFFATAELLLLLAFIEYARLAEACGFPLPRIPAGAATLLASIGVSSAIWVNDSLAGTAVLLDVVLMSGFVVLGSIALVSLPGGRIDRDTFGRTASAAFPMLYLGLPVGALVSLRAHRGREALFLLMLAVMVSDTAQYYTGRAFGRRLLAPAISPKKTVEGAIGGFVFGGALLGIVGRWWLPEVPAALRVALGMTVVALGIAGDLFESMLKRSAGVKDSSALIPGHGGVLDRIDALLFAAPVYYIVLKFL
jgi:phosphatidate cytidylyltransferase